MVVEALVAGAKVFQKPIAELYEQGKDTIGNRLARWRVNKNINQLYKKISLVQKVKTIWQVDKEVKLSSFYYPSKLKVDGKDKEITDVRDIPTTGNVVLQGTVGQGKSIFLRYLCIRELAQGSRIPIFMELRRIEKEQKLTEFLVDGLRSLNFDISGDVFDFYAASGKFVLLLDGFDELDKSLVTSIVSELEQVAVRYPSLQVLVTSRPDSGIERSPHFRVFQLAPLTPNDHRLFLKNIIPEQQKVDDILRAIQQNSAKIGGLLTTPLMLTLLVIIYKAEQKIPNELSEFYEHLFQTLISRHDKSKPGFVRKRYCQLGEREMQQLFEAFCFVTRQKGLSVLTEDQLHTSIELGARHSGITCDPRSFEQDMNKVACLMQEEAFKYHFIHKSVQEYHAASFIRHCTDDMATKFYDKLIAGAWVNWRQELVFLAQIDKYRFAKHFRMSLIERVLTTYQLSKDSTNSQLAVSLLEKVLSPCNLSFQKVDDGFQIGVGYLGHHDDYIMSEVELAVFGDIFRYLGERSNKIGPELEPHLQPVKSGPNTEYQISIKKFSDALGMENQVLGYVNKAFQAVIKDYKDFEEYVKREDSKETLLDLARS